MWTCPRCHTENKEGYTACEGCGAARSAGRFGSAAPPQDSRQPSGSYAPPIQSAPRAQTIPTKPLPLRPAPDANPPYPEPEMREKRMHKAGGGILTAMGTLLAILLPGLGVLTAVLTYDTLSPALLLLLFGDNPQPAVVTIAVYIAVVFIAELLLLLPGAWALSQGRLHTRLARMERLL